MSELDPRLYTVAWIAPLEIEARAALHMFDNRHHGRFPTSRGDDYLFHAGDVCGHNVILATLPAGQEYGTGSAAALASQVKKFFPNLWFGLLVGVAAGLPNLSRNPPRDIRLGDVLVALPEGESAGLVAYDLGKETGTDGFQLLRFGHVLAATETVVRAAIGSIKINTPNDTERFLPFYKDVEEKEHENGTFTDPGQDKDMLYEVDADGMEKLVERERRQASRRTRVWYGPIGSGEKLMRNAQKRNELRDKYNVIGLEMEAAGTMNRIPVGVIRGVCDYGDEHKNKEWQPYAAAMAAAYAKAVLREILPSKPPVAVSASTSTPQGSGGPIPGFNGLISGNNALAPTPCRAIPFPRNEDIVRRAAIFLELDALLPQSREYQSAALWGLGGSGKTQIALEYAYRRSGDPACSVFWVHADNETTFAQDYKTIAKRLGLPGGLDGPELLMAVRERIEANPCWLLVLDNADNLAAFGVGRTQSNSDQSQGAEEKHTLYDFVPRGPAGTVLWTSRDKRIGGSLVGARRAINVASMTQGEARMLLETAMCRVVAAEETQDAMALLAELEWLPLAVSQAAAYMRRRATPISEYLSRLRRRMKRWEVLSNPEFDRHRRRGISNNVMQTWDISIEHIRQESQIAYDILHTLAFLDNQNIPFELVAKAAEMIGTPTRNEETTSANSRCSRDEDQDEDQYNNEEIQEVVLLLQYFSFLRPRILGERQQAYEMHKLVQEATQYSLSQENRRKDESHFSGVALRVVTDLFPDSRREVWVECERYLGHALQAAEWAGLCKREEEAAALLIRVSGYLYDCGRWREKEPVDESAYKYRRKVLGVRHPDTIQSMASRAATYHAQGRYSEAEKITVEALALRRNVLGERHPDTIRSIADLAATYHAQGRFDEAEKIRVEVLALVREVLGKRHPDTIWSMADLAATYHAQGRFDEAEEMSVEVLTLQHDTLGQVYPDTIRNLADLAVIYHAQGRYSDAEKISAEVLAQQRNVLGTGHPDTLYTMHVLAFIWNSRQRRPEALALMQKCFQLRCEVLGETHPHTQQSLHALNRWKADMEKSSCIS